MLLTVAGSSCSGKTTAGRACADLPNLAVHDFDEVGVPDGAAFVGWAGWLRGHAADPRHRPEVITTDAWPEMVWNRWTAWTADDPRWTVTVLDTTDRTPTEAAADLREWIRAAGRR